MNTPSRELLCNAWFDASADCRLAADTWPWVSERPLPMIGAKLLPTPKDIRLWQEVGWSLVLPWSDDFSTAELAEPTGVPESLRQLWQERGRPPIYRSDPKHAGYLIRCSRDDPYRQALEPPDASLESMGHGPDQVPFFLLIHGGPDSIPWDVQFRLNATRAVGRLDLEDAALDNYVTHLRHGWKEQPRSGYRTLVWATEHDAMTTLMRRALAEPLHDRYRTDNSPELAQAALFLAGEQALGPKLAAALTASKPGLIVTTSHGYMNLADPKIDDLLGLPVDQNKKPLKPASILKSWQPDGAIWFGYACSSAGTCRRNSFAGLLDSKCAAAGFLDEAARRFGSRISPLPRLLLSATCPLRAFVGHIEPTFDRALMNPDTGGFQNGGLLDGFYTRLFDPTPTPLGAALHTFFRPFVQLRNAAGRFQKRWNANDPMGEAGVLATHLRALDIGNTVILGDPTVSLSL